MLWLICKILDGECVQPVIDAFSDLKLVDNPEARGRGASKVHITNMKHTLRKTSLNTFKRCFIARAHDIFDKMPRHLIDRGIQDGWTCSVKGVESVMKSGQKFLAPRLPGERVSKAEINTTKVTAKGRNRTAVVSNKTVTVNNRPIKQEIRQAARFNSQ